MFQWLRNYFANQNQYKKDLIATTEAPRLHGVNLNDWQYLGRSEIAYVYSDPDRVDKANVFLFCGINNTDLRKYVLITHNSYLEDKFKSHPWIVTHIELWKVCEKELYDSVNQEPSKFLKDLMMEKHQAVWSNEKHWWTTNDNAKYETAKKEQTKQKKNEILSVEDNIVKIDFKKEKETS